MKSVKKYISSGILESYVLGITSAEESAEVEEMSAAHSEIYLEIQLIRASLERYAELHAVQPAVTAKPLILATIEYIERLKNGEPVYVPPVLHNESVIEDYAFWLNNEAAILPDNFTNLHARIIGHTPEVTTAIVWIKEYTPPEVHRNELERFLIVEGTCEIVIGNEVHSLVPGDVLNIPLHIQHRVTVTSDVPCKAILQRIAA